MQLKGETYRLHKNRKTQKIIINNQAYFLKQHHPAGLNTILQSILAGHMPILDAKNEWQAIKKLQSIGINTPDLVDMRYQGLNPMRRQSFLLTKELPPHITLETLAKFIRNFVGSPTSFDVIL